MRSAGDASETHDIPVGFETAALVDAVDGPAAAPILVDSRPQILFANSAGKRLLDEASVLRRAAGRLSVPDQRAQQALHDMIDACDRAGASLRDRGLALPLPSRDGETW